MIGGALEAMRLCFCTLAVPAKTNEPILPSIFLPILAEIKLLISDGFILSGEAKLHSSLYEKQYSNQIPNYPGSV
ncbi:MAG: hypothetical protein LBU32_33280 [Clostridiales bacterium]|nr:hypothetical protein [Clostridiales bacterium]